MQSSKKHFLSFFFFLTISLSFVLAQNNFSGIYVNYQPLTQYQANLLQQLTGPLYTGYYYVDNYGNFGMSGYRPFVNLNQAFEAWQVRNQQAQRSNSGSYKSEKESYRKTGTGYSWNDGKGNSGYKSDITGHSISRSGEDFLINLGDGVIISNF